MERVQTVYTEVRKNKDSPAIKSSDEVANACRTSGCISLSLSLPSSFSSLFMVFVCEGGMEEVGGGTRRGGMGEKEDSEARERAAR